MPSQPLRSSTASEPVRAVSEIVGIGWIASARVVAGQIRGRSRRILEVTYDGCAVAARQAARCQGCHVHDQEPATYDHGLDVPLALRAIRISFDCIHGGRKADVAPGLNPRWMMTEDCLGRVARAVLTGTIAETARRFRIAPRKVADLLACLRQELTSAIPLPEELSVDDLHLLRHGTCTVVTDPRRRRFIALIKGHPHEVFVAWLQRQPGHDRVRAIVTDGDSKLRAALRSCCPDKAHGADPYHKIKLVTDEVVGASRVLLPKECRRRIGVTANAGTVSRRDGFNRLLRKRWHRMTQSQRRLLEAVFAGCPELGDLYALREAFIAFYNIRSPEVAATALDGWLASIPPGLMRFFGTPRNTIGRAWRREVLAYFRRRITQGFTESINRRLKQRHLSTGCSESVAALELWARVRYGGYAGAVIERAIATVAARQRPKRRASRNTRPREFRHAA